MAATTYLVPPVAILLGWAMLGESPELLAFLGGALCLVGVGIARQSSLRLRGETPPETIRTRPLQSSGQGG
jgi:drug/metabolite transporter (DMT)-like permease